MSERAPPSVDLDDLRVFTRVVAGGSFTRAASALRMPKSTVSRKIAELEARVGARLLQRTTRAVRLTEVGRVYHEHCLRIVAELDEAARAVAELQSAPRGVLRVTVPLAFGMLGPIIAEYLRMYPEIEVDMVCTDRLVDIVEGRFDLALRAGTPPDSSLTARRLGSVKRRLVAAPELCAKLGTPQELGDLARHPCIAFAPEGRRWELAWGPKTTSVALRPRLTVNDYEMLREVARAGFGIALLPEHLCRDDVKSGRLVWVLASWTAPEIPLFALYPSTRHLSPKVAALLDLLRERLLFDAPGPAGERA